VVPAARGLPLLAQGRRIRLEARGFQDPQRLRGGGRGPQVVPGSFDLEQVRQDGSRGGPRMATRSNKNFGGRIADLHSRAESRVAERAGRHPVPEEEEEDRQPQGEAHQEASQVIVRQASSRGVPKS